MLVAFADLQPIRATGSRAMSDASESAAGDGYATYEPDSDTHFSQPELTPEVWNVATHNGWVTIENPETGRHRTFQVETISDEASAEYMRGKRVVRLLTGPDRDNDTTGFAFVSPEGQVQVWKRFRSAVVGQSSEWEKFARLLQFPAHFAGRGLVYHIEGRCRRCNRPLTHPQSIMSGIGPICAGRE